MPNWKSILEKQNAAAYAWPRGWSSRDDVAEQLECSPERVASLLAPGIRAGTVERQDFTVWDNKLKRLVRITGYRELGKNETPAAADSKKFDEPAPAREPMEGSRVRRRRGSGKVGILSKDGKRWKITWPHCKPTYPSGRAFGRDLDVL
jgi:hypothetical protein